jgi:hypothetical protein
VRCAFVFVRVDMNRCAIGSSKIGNVQDNSDEDLQMAKRAWVPWSSRVKMASADSTITLSFKGD